MELVTRWIRRLHMYSGLLSFTILMIFGIAGLAATFQVERLYVVTIDSRPFDPPPNASDFEAAMAAYAFLALPVSAPPAPSAVHRDAAHNVTFTNYPASGIRVITILEGEHQVRVEGRRNRMWHFFDNLHATTMTNDRTPDLRMRMWTWYTEFSIWSLIWMSVSGIYLWIASARSQLLGWISFVIGTGGFALLYWLFR